MRNRKKIVVFFGKSRNCADPFASFGKKRAVYHQLFKKGLLRGLEMYIASGRDSYLGNLNFQDPWIYNGSFFEKQTGIISADAVYDRSGGLKFPTEEISFKVLNGIGFKQLCYDKNLTYALLAEFMPKSYPVKNTADLHEALKNFAADELAVLKPVSGFGGKNILIDSPKNLSSSAIQNSIEYALQQFVDTSAGISGITSGHHDLRAIIVNGGFVLCHVRAPQKGSLLANVAQGGSIKEVAIALVPGPVKQIISTVSSIIDSAFDMPVYSIDFGVCHDKPYIFELNDQIGFPSENMHDYPLFIDGILESLARLAARPIKT